MSEKEHEVLRKIIEAVPKLDKEKQSYVLGLAEGMALVKETETKDSQCVSK